MRGVLALTGLVSFVGCGLSLAPSGPGAGADAGGPDATSADGRVDPPPPTDAAPPPKDAPIEPEKALTAREEQAVPGLVIAMAIDGTGTTALVDDTATLGTYTAYTVGARVPLFSFKSPDGQPTSFTPIPTVSPFPAPTTPRALFTVGTSGLYLALQDTSSAAFGDNATVQRIVRAHGELFASTPSPSAGTLIYACPVQATDATVTDCATGLVVYDSIELGGFILSDDRLLLAGLTGSGTNLQLVTSTRASLADSFITPTRVKVDASLLEGAEELLTVANGGESLALRGTCHPNTLATCLVKLSK